MNSYFNSEETVFDITERYPEVIPVLVQLGFTPLANPAMRMAMGKKISLLNAVNARGLDIAAVEKDLIAAIEGAAGSDAAQQDASLRTIKNVHFREQAQAQTNVRIEGVLPCPIRIPLMDRFEQFYNTYITDHKAQMAEEQYGIRYDLRSANLGLDWVCDQVRTGDLDAIPDVLLSAGFELFFEKDLMGKFISAGDFSMDIPDMNRDFCNDYIDLRDPNKQYGIIGVVPAILIVNTEELGDRPIPRSWADILKPEYEDSLAMPMKDLDLFNAVILHIYRFFGEEGVKNLLRSYHKSLHPAQMVKTQGSRSKAPAINIGPYFFTKMLPRDSAVKAVWPSDGAIVSPIFMLAKQKSRAKSQAFIDFFLSQTIGEVFANSGFFPSTNALVDNRLDASQNFCWMGWDYIHQNDIGSILKHCEHLFGLR